VQRLTPKMLETIKEVATRNCARFGMSHLRDDEVQDTVLLLLTPSQKSGLSPLDVFDPTKDWEGYIGSIIYHRMCRRYRLSRHPVEQAIPIDDVFFEGIEPEECDTIFLKECEVQIFDLLNRMFPPTRCVVTNEPLTINSVRKRLVLRPPAKVRVKKGEVVVPVSHATVFRFLLNGWGQNNMADLFGYSRGWVHRVVKAIREVPEVGSLIHSRHPEPNFCLTD
jgi:hypothetical protein